MKTRVLLDTNFLMIPYLEGIDIFSEIKRLLSTDPAYEICVPEDVKKELSQLAQKCRGRDRIAAKLGLQLIDSMGIAVIPAKGTGSVDSQIINLAEKDHNIIVCTNDHALKNTLRKLGIRLITMRGRSHLEYC